MSYSSTILKLSLHGLFKSLSSIASHLASYYLSTGTTTVMSNHGYTLEAKGELGKSTQTQSHTHMSPPQPPP